MAFDKTARDAAAAVSAQVDGLTADQIADGETHVSMTVVERGKVDTIDNSGTRWVYGKRIAYASMGLDGRMAMAITEDGYHYAKYAIRLAVGNGLSWTRGADGFHELKFGDAEGALPLGVAGDVVDSTSLGYLNGKKVLRAVADQSGRMAMAITDDGYIRGKFAIRLAVANGLSWTRGIDGMTTLAFGAAEGALPLGAAGDVVDSRSLQYHRGRTVKRAVSDQNGRAAHVIYADGSAWSAVFRSPSLTPGETLVDLGDHIVTATRIGAVSQLVAYTKVSGKRSQITAAGSNGGLTRSADGRIIYLTDRHGEPLRPYWQSPGEWIERPAFPRRGLVGVGDSLMYGTGALNPATDAIVAQVAAHLSLPFVNLGRPGGTAQEIVGYIDAVHPLVTMSGNQIVTGANSITAIDIPFLSSNGNSGTSTQKRTIAGIVGTVTKTGGVTPDWIGTYSFTPDAGQTLPVACPAGSPAILATNKNSELIAIIRVGRNVSGGGAYDATWSDDAFARTQTIINWLKPLVKNFVILPVPNGSIASEYAGATNYVGIMAHNARLAAEWPDNYLDDRALLVAAYDPAVAQDVLDHSRDVPPSSLRSDTVHWTTAGYAISAAAIRDFINAKGWLLEPLLIPYA